MTTNKPEVVAWLNETWVSATESRQVVRDWEDNGSVVTSLVRLSDYEALQSERDVLREALFEARATMTSALSFEPGINEVTKKALAAEIERIKSLLSEGGNKS